MQEKGLRKPRSQRTSRRRADGVTGALARSEGDVNWHALLPGPIVLSLAVLLRIGLGFVGAGAGEEKPLLPDGGKDKRGFDEAKATDFLRSKVMGNV